MQAFLPNNMKSCGKSWQEKMHNKNALHRKVERLDEIICERQKPTR